MTTAPTSSARTIEIERQGDERPGSARARLRASAALATRRAHALVMLRRAAGSRGASTAGRHQQADLVLVRGPSVDERRRSGRGTSPRSGPTARGPRRARPRRAGRPCPRRACSIVRRWMNSMLPTSRPRVGWSRTSSLQLAVELARDDHLLLIAARQRAGRDARPMASGCRSRGSLVAARSSIAASLRRMPARVRRPVVAR